MKEGILESSALYLFTSAEYIEQALYDPNWGYYSSGKVKFGNDFDTHAIELAPLIALKAHKVWCSMINDGDILPNELFYVYEFGAGTGEMALTFLKYVHGMALTSNEPYWKDFYTVLRYQIGEISPELIKLQTENLKHYISLKKVDIHHSDARKSDHIIPKGKGMVVSNELIDAFPVNQLKLSLNPSKEVVIEPMICAPAIPESLLLGMIHEKDPALKQEKLEKHKSKLTKLQKSWNVPSNTIKKMQEDKKYFISKKDMDNLLKFNREKYSSLIQMITWPAPLDVLALEEINLINSIIEESKPILKEYLKKHSEKILCIHTEAKNYFKKLAPILEKGYVMTIDYGAGGYEYIHDKLFYLRTYSKDLKLENIHATAGSAYENPGRKDITVNVNFSDFAKIGLEQKFEPVYFGMQAALGGTFVKEFYLLFQEYNMPAQNFTQRRKEIFSNVLSAPVTYAEIAEKSLLLNQGTQLLESLKSSTGDLSSKLYLLLEWFTSINYLDRDYSFSYKIEEELMFFLSGYLNLLCKNNPTHLNTFFDNSIKNILKPEHLKILIVMIYRLTKTVFNENLTETISYAEKILIDLKTLIANYLKAKKIDQICLPNEESIVEFNFKNLTPIEKSKTHLSQCLSAADAEDPAIIATMELIKRTQEEILTSNNIIDRISCPAYNDKSAPELLHHFKQRLVLYRSISSSILSKENPLNITGVSSDFIEFHPGTFAHHFTGELVMSYFGLGECSECTATLLVKLLNQVKQDIGYVMLNFDNADQTMEQLHCFLVTNLTDISALPKKSSSYEDFFSKLPKQALIVDAFLEVCFYPDNISNTFLRYIEAYGGKATVIKFIHLKNYKITSIKFYQEKAAQVIEKMKTLDPIRQDTYNLDNKIKFVNNSLVSMLNEKQSLPFFSVSDEDCKVDALACLDTPEHVQEAELIKRELKGYGRFFTTPDKKSMFVLEGVNLFHDNAIRIQENLGRYISNKQSEFHL